MKKYALILILLPFFFGCNTGNKHAEQNISLVEKYISSVEDLDYKTMASLLSEDYYGFGPSFGDSIGKLRAVDNWKYNIEQLYEKIEYKKMQNAAVTITNGINKGEWVANWAELRITYKNDVVVTIMANTNYMIKDNKIVKSYTFYNEADVLEQLGYVFINPKYF
jgi:hypothetical protein